CCLDSRRRVLRSLPSLPTRRSSDLEVGCGSGLLSLLAARKGARVTAFDIDERAVTCARENFQQNLPHAAAVVLRSDLFSEIEKQDRKSTRLNSSHVKISYAVFCLKK